LDPTGAVYDVIRMMTKYPSALLANVSKCEEIEDFSYKYKDKIVVVWRFAPPNQIRPKSANSATNITIASPHPFSVVSIFPSFTFFISHTKFELNRVSRF